MPNTPKAIKTRSENVPRVCIACGASYIPFHKDKQKYCTLVCATTYRNRRIYGRRKQNGLCLWCGKSKVAEGRWNCDTCRVVQLNYGPRLQWRRAQLKHKYGITLETFNKMLETQGGVCFICGKGNQGKLINAPLSVDHCHETGKIRGLLCSPCNSRLGWYETFSNKIKEYLDRQE